MEWDPTQFFRDSNTATPFALLILNQPINERAFTVLNKHAYFTICADGGANRFYDMMHKHGREATDLPDIIIGDLDSIRPDVRSHYENLGVPVLQDPDQNSTDFTKCLTYLRVHARGIIERASAPATTAAAAAAAATLPAARLEILIMGGLGGRVDQAFSQIHHLYMITQQDADAAGDLYLVSEESITFILRPGRHSILTPGANRPGVDGGGAGHLLEENVGIIPLSGPARITTRGLQWDVVDWETGIGGRISTSNHIRADVVGVETGVPVLFTLELAERFKRVR